VGSPHVGEIEAVSVTEVWSRLSGDANSVLVDVRTSAEWSYVGVPDLSSLGKQPILVEWQTFPGGIANDDFAAQLGATLAQSGVAKDAEIFFICRSGVRSKRAAGAIMEAGYMHCRNVADGFEGPLDPSRHRGRAGGWKAAGLPWVQS